MRLRRSVSAEKKSLKSETKFPIDDVEPKPKRRRLRPKSVK